MLIFRRGTAIHSLHTSYSSPSFLSLFPDASGGYYESKSLRLPKSTSVRHMMWYTASGLRAHRSAPDELTCDLMITDYLAREEKAFLRVFEGSAPVRWRISTPNYVRTARVNDYHLIHIEADALFCTIAQGIPTEGGYPTAREQSLVFYLCGAMRFEEDGRVVCFDGGRGYMLFLDNASPIEALRLADRILDGLNAGTMPSELPLFSEAEEDWRTLCPNALDRSAMRPEDAAAALCMMQSADGTILTDVAHPYATAADLPLLTAALLKLGRVDAAWRMIDCWSNKLGEHGIPSIAECDAILECTDDDCDGHATAAFLLAAMLLLETAGDNSDPKSVDLLLRKLRKAFTLTAKYSTDGMLPFSTTDKCFETGLLSRESLYHGSAIATATAIAAAERYIGYCMERGYKIARESQRYIDILAESESKYGEHFAKDRLISLNAPEFEQKTHRPRFIRSICPVCSTGGEVTEMQVLELSRSGHYRCKSCLLSKRHDESNLDRAILSLDATATVALWMPSPYSDDALCRAAAYYRQTLDANESLPLRFGGCDAMLLAAARKAGTSCTDAEGIFRRVLTETATLDEDPQLELGALPSRWAEGRRMTEPFCNSAAIAALILALGGE